MGGVFTEGLFSGRTAVVTGGGSGIGLAMSTEFARLGASVVIVGRNPERLEHAVAAIADATGAKPSSFSCDVREPERIEKLRDHVLETLGPPAILVNNAAANFRMAAARMTRRALSTVVDIDLMGTFNITRAFIDDMTDAGGGNVLNIIVADAERGFPGFSHAGAAKAAILSLTRSWAREWGPLGIRVNAIGPGPVPTAGVAHNMLNLDRTSDAFSAAEDRIPLGRRGTPQDVADSAVFLCSPAASWITGICLPVDGGYNLP